VILHGSAAFDDLAPGYGDLDFVAVCRDGLSEHNAQLLMRARAPFRSGRSGVYARMLEGAFLPHRMLDPRQEGLAVWWGTSGERLWDRNRLGWFCHVVVRDWGIVVHGDDVRERFPSPSHEELAQEVRDNCRAIEEHGSGGSLHSVDWLLTAARLLLWLEENLLSSKTEAAEWGADNARGAWRALLPRAKQLRQRPRLADEPEMKSWLNSLGPAIAEAARELEDRLSCACG
jgi:hypothetical protein